MKDHYLTVLSENFEQQSSSQERMTARSLSRSILLMVKKVYVTQPHLPPLAEFMPYLEKIWDNRILTNGGPFHQEFEQALADYLGVKYLSLFSNGTLALVTALQALRVTGEVITTPYSFVATAHSLLWNGLKPVFVDIDPKSMNLDPEKIEAAITPFTTCILPVHCYGRPCNVDAIERIADIYNLKVIYDAAHAFGVRANGQSILQYGDLSILSFHATKVFNTFEGGAIICPNEKIKLRIDHLKNFGFVDETTVVAPGINGKMSEFNSALGLLQLKHVEMAISRREDISNIYRNSLAGTPHISIPDAPAIDKYNYAYFPILIDDTHPKSRDDLYHHLAKNEIYARRYFHPLISNFSMYRALASADPARLPFANQIARQILCLPIYPDLHESTIDRIVQLIRDF